MEWRFTGVAFLVAGAAACRPAQAPVLVVDAPIQRPVMVMPVRVCIDRQADSVRRLRAGRTGLAKTHEVIAALGAASPEQRAAGAYVADSCADLIELEESREAVERFLASPEVVRRMRASGARTAFVTEIATRLVCAPRRGGGPGSACHEDDVVVTAILFGEDARIMRAASAPVHGPEDAVAIARAVLPASGSTPPGAVGQRCRLVADTLDCT